MDRGLVARQPVNRWRRTVARAPRSEPEPVAAEPASAKEALDRIVIPQDVLDRISPMASPRSSLIISDEALSSRPATARSS